MKKIILFMLMGILAVSLVSAGWFDFGTPPPSKGGGSSSLVQVNGSFNSYLANGSNANGTDGQAYRSLYLNVSNLSLVQTVAVDSYIMIKNYQYTINGNNITFVNPLYDDQKIQIDYISASNVTSVTNILTLSAADLIGSDGSIDRSYPLNNTFMQVSVDSYYMIKNTQYIANSTGFRFLIPVWNDQIIQVIYNE